MFGMNRLIFCLTLWIAALCGVAEASFRVATYNILAEVYAKPAYYPNHQKEEFLWESRFEKLLARIDGLQADLLNLQEVEPHIFDKIHAHLAPQGYVGIYAKKGHLRPEGCACFFKKELGTFLSAQTLFYQDKLPGDKDPFSGHIALIAKFEIEGRTVAFLNTHIRRDDHGFNEVVQLVSEYVTDSSVDEWFVMGDFNHPPSSQIYELMQALFEDPFEPVAFPTVSFDGIARIDYIFHQGEWPVVANSQQTVITVPNSLPNQEEPSDHLPITVEVLTD